MAYIQCHLHVFPLRLSLQVFPIENKKPSLVYVELLQCCVFFALKRVRDVLVWPLCARRLTAATWWRRRTGAGSTCALATWRTWRRPGTCTTTCSDASPNSCRRWADPPEATTRQLNFSFYSGSHTYVCVCACFSLVNSFIFKKLRDCFWLSQNFNDFAVTLMASRLFFFFSSSINKMPIILMHHRQKNGETFGLVVLVVIISVCASQYSVISVSQKDSRHLRRKCLLYDPSN